MFTVFGKKNCANCEMSKFTLMKGGHEFTYSENNTEMVERVMEATGAPPKSFPQIFDGDVYVGGYDKLKEYLSARSSELTG